MAETHMPLERLATAIRGDGFECIIRPGAQGKSARRFSKAYGSSVDGYYMGCQAVSQHHTVSSGQIPLWDVQYIESGQGDGFVISNAYTAINAVIWLIASGPTYTEGSGGPLGIIPAGRANDVTFSNEIASWGAENSVYPNKQQDAAACLAYHAGLIAAEVWEWPGDPFAYYRAYGHFEWTDRKVDPRGISRWSLQGGMWRMDEFRLELRNRLITTPPPEDSPLFHIITNAQNAAFRMKGFNDVVALVNGTPQPVTHENAHLFGISPAQLTELIQNPVKTHLNTVAWLRAQGIEMTPSTGNV